MSSASCGCVWSLASGKGDVNHGFCAVCVTMSSAGFLKANADCSFKHPAELALLRSHCFPGQKRHLRPAPSSVPAGTGSRPGGHHCPGGGVALGEPDWRSRLRGLHNAAEPFEPLSRATLPLPPISLSCFSWLWMPEF